MGKLKIKGILTRSFILLLFIPVFSYPQCIKKLSSEHSFNVSGISDGYNHYYLNLIIQDLAISEQKRFEDIQLRFSYKINYSLNLCQPKRLEVTAVPFTVSCSSILYKGFNISGSIKPEKADLVFYIFQRDGFLIDSLIFNEFSLLADSSLYTTVSYAVGDSASFYNVVSGSPRFQFTKASYELFRDKILEIDNFYAASLIGDSALQWAAGGFLSEDRNRAELQFRSLELERIAAYINPGKFPELPGAGKKEGSGLRDKYNELMLLANRYRGIIRYDRFNSDSLDHSTNYETLLESLLHRLDHYYYLAYNSDFHYVNFIEGLADPSFLYSFLKDYFNYPDSGSTEKEHEMQLIGNQFIKGLTQRGEEFEKSGNQLRALRYYEAAFRLADSVQDKENLTYTYELTERMTYAMASSYLDISKRSALRYNPAMAAKYFNEAQALFADNEIIKSAPLWIDEYEAWLNDNFEDEAVKNVTLKNYTTAMDYLKEIQGKCLFDESFTCPGNFHEWMRETREGLYLQLLDQALALVNKEEFSEAEQEFNKAISMRVGGGYRISKDLKETRIEQIFSQMRYNEYWEEGLGDFHRGDYISALYYFNKADFLRREGVPGTEENLYDLRQFAARQVILRQLSDGRVKVWANDFNAAAIIIRQVERMINDYQFSQEDSVYRQYISLSESLVSEECKVIADDYGRIIAGAEQAEQQGNFVLALEQYNKAAKLSLENLKCRIDDEKAWVGKIKLEPLARYQKMEAELDLAVYISVNEYLDRYNKLRKYYSRNKLEMQGVKFNPLIDRVLAQTDSLFLSGMLSHFIYLTDYEHAFLILKKIRTSGYRSDEFKDQQKYLAGKLANLDLKEHPDQDPWTLLGERTEGDRWYRTFSWNYKLSCLKINKWNINSWPVIWRK